MPATCLQGVFQTLLSELQGIRGPCPFKSLSNLTIISYKETCFDHVLSKTSHLFTEMGLPVDCHGGIRMDRPQPSPEKKGKTPSTTTRQVPLKPKDGKDKGPSGGPKQTTKETRYAKHRREVSHENISATHQKNIFSQFVPKFHRPPPHHGDKSISSRDETQDSGPEIIHVQDDIYVDDTM